MTPPTKPTEEAAAAAPAAARRRAHCTRCLRPASTCMCRWARPTANQVRLLVLQRPQEQHHAKGTVRLLQLSLQHCQVAVATPDADGAQFDAAELSRWLLGGRVDGQGGDHVGHAGHAQDDVETGRPLSSWLLYPAASAADPGRRPAEGPSPASAANLPLGRPEAVQLVLLDGTWRQSRQLLRQHPALQQLPRWPLPAQAAQLPAAYPLRRAHRPEQRSSLEAACHALALLEGQAWRYAPLLSAFALWQAAQLQHLRQPLTKQQQQ